MTSEEIRLECIREAVKLCALSTPLVEGGQAKYKDPVELAKQFAGFVFGFEWDAESEEWVEPEGDDTELAPQVRAFDDEGQEL